MKYVVDVRVAYWYTTDDEEADGGSEATYFVYGNASVEPGY